VCINIRDSFQIFHVYMFKTACQSVFGVSLCGGYSSNYSNLHASLKCTFYICIASCLLQPLPASLWDVIRFFTTTHIYYNNSLFTKRSSREDQITTKSWKWIGTQLLQWRWGRRPRRRWVAEVSRTHTPGWTDRAKRWLKVGRKSFRWRSMPATERCC
jgi:hypothetical protein